MEKSEAEHIQQTYSRLSDQWAQGIRDPRVRETPEFYRVSGALTEIHRLMSALGINIVAHPATEEGS